MFLSSFLSFIDQRFPPEKKELLFPTFFLSGFESSTFRWRNGERRNLIKESEHDVQADNDYKIIRALGIGASREAVPWPFADTKGGYNFSCIDPMIAAINKYDIVPIWDLCHYGYPDDLDPFSDEFATRFASYAAAAAKYIAARTKAPYFFSPINEITYFAFIGGKWGHAAPYKKSAAAYNALRLSLCKAAIAGVKAIRQIIPGARMIHVDPLVEVVAPLKDPSKNKIAWEESHVDTYRAWDILYGRLHPELGGSPAILDIVGVNNYAAGYLEYKDDKGPHTPLKENDSRVVTLCSLLQFVYKRYQLPIIISETSGVNETRVTWLKDMMEECLAAINKGVDIQAVCLFPAIGSPSWDKGEWIQSGFYNVEKKDGILERTLFEPYVAELLRWQKELDNVTMLTDEPSLKKTPAADVKKTAQRLKPVADRDWHRR
jgi:beta-glucosidase/6-phospho-beta-glucosidase/beta-galactosidase